VSTDPHTQGRLAAERAARDSYGRLVAWLAARSGDIAGAEDALSDAFASALATWPVKGAPAKPEAWLMAAAKRKLVDSHRRRKTGVEAAGHLRLMAEEAEDAMTAPDLLPDRRLALMFACACWASTPPPSARPVWCRPPPWARGWCGPRPRSARRASV
jgi:RNA polymerase sigma-70 factor (ECF subfamily)